MDAPDPHPTVAPPPENSKKRNLSSEERRDIVSTLLLSVKPDDPELKLARGIITATAQRFDVDRSTIRLVWQRALANYQNPNIHSFISSPLKKGNSGAKLKWDRDEICEAVKTIPLHQKRFIQILAGGLLGTPKSTDASLGSKRKRLRRPYMSGCAYCCCETLSNILKLHISATQE